MIELLRRGLRARRTTFFLLALYAVLRIVIGFTSGDHGLVTPEGRIDLAFGALAASVLSLRLAILFLVLPSLAYALLRAITDGRLRAGSPPSRE